MSLSTAGLFTADQINGNSRSRQIHTRQNPNGQRRGLESPEERDYYPYWRASPFMDLAYLTSNPGTARARSIRAESQNVKARGKMRQ